MMHQTGTRLALSGEWPMVTCPRCKGAGKEIAGTYKAVRTLNKGMPADTPGDKSFIPCRKCRGAKVVPA